MRQEQVASFCVYVCGGDQSAAHEMPCTAVEGGPTLLFQGVPGRVTRATQPPGARLRAPTPGLAPWWSLGNVNPGDIIVLF